MPATIANPAQSLPWREWYGLLKWKKRAHHQLQIEPLCALCSQQGRVTPATIADHDPPHKGDWNAFRLARCARSAPSATAEAKGSTPAAITQVLATMDCRPIHPSEGECAFDGSGDGGALRAWRRCARRDARSGRLRQLDDGRADGAGGRSQGAQRGGNGEFVAIR
jgi:hypothetical protein